MFILIKKISGGENMTEEREIQIESIIRMIVGTNLTLDLDYQRWLGHGNKEHSKYFEEKRINYILKRLEFHRKNLDFDPEIVARFDKEIMKVKAIEEERMKFYESEKPEGQPGD